MKRNLELVIASLLSLVLLTFHLADDVGRGMFPAAGPGINYAAIASGILLYCTVMLADRRSGVLGMLGISLAAIAMPVLHTSSAGVGAISKSSGGLAFVWTLIALGALGTFSFIAAVRALWTGARQ